MRIAIAMVVSPQRKEGHGTHWGTRPQWVDKVDEDGCGPSGNEGIRSIEDGVPGLGKDMHAEIPACQEEAGNGRTAGARRR
jgi:hypothetical protein